MDEDNFARKSRRNDGKRRGTSIGSRRINDIRPHMPSLTIDVAFVASKPKNSTIEEPSVCLGIWRIDKVDFERCAVFPESTIEETAHALSMLFQESE